MRPYFWFLGLFIFSTVFWAAAPARAEDSAYHYVFAWKFIPMRYTLDEKPWETQRNDIRAATEMGLDGFALESYHYSHAQELMRTWPDAADKIGAHDFKFFLVLDMGKKEDGSDRYTIENIFEIVKTFGQNPHYLKIEGRPVFSTYNQYASNLGDDWWKRNVIEPLQKMGYPIFFIPFFDRKYPNAIPPTYDNWLKLVDQFPSTDGFLLFSPPKGVPYYLDDPLGGRQEWSGLEAEENEAKALHDRNKFFASPYQPYYWQNCKEPRPYFEYQGGRGMDNYWKSAIFKQKPEMVVLVTWDDYSESTFVQPTHIPTTKYKGIEVFPHLGYYELLKYYISWYKTGKQPLITHDGMFYFYRTQSKDAVITKDQACPLPMTQPDQRWGNIQDYIYLTVALTKEAELTVRTGDQTKTFDLKAGLNILDTPFSPGPQNFELRRNGRLLTAMKGRDINGKPEVFNFNIFSGYAIVNGRNSDTWTPGDNQKGSNISNWFMIP